jgi:hypothetical protein
MFRRDPRICGHQSTKRKPNRVAGHQLGGSKLDPMAVATGERRWRETFFQRRECRAGAAFLNEAQSGVEQEQSRNHRRFDIFPKSELDDEGGFEQPGNRRPEFCQVGTPARRRRFTDRIGTEQGETAARFVAGQADGCIDRCLASVRLAQRSINHGANHGGTCEWIVKCANSSRAGSDVRAE